jgi:hypothetical protein
LPVRQHFCGKHLLWFGFHRGFIYNENAIWKVQKKNKILGLLATYDHLK